MDARDDLLSLDLRFEWLVLCDPIGFRGFDDDTPDWGEVKCFNGETRASTKSSELMWWVVNIFSLPR